MMIRCKEGAKLRQGYRRKERGVQLVVKERKEREGSKS